MLYVASSAPAAKPAAPRPARSTIFTRSGLHRSSLMRSLHQLLYGRVTPKGHRTAHGLLTMPFLPDSDVPHHMPVTRLRSCLHALFTRHESVLGLAVMSLLYSIIIASVASFCVSTLPEVRLAVVEDRDTPELATLALIDRICLVVFVIDYLMRILTVTSEPARHEELALEARADWRRAVAAARAAESAHRPEERHPDDPMSPQMYAAAAWTTWQEPVELDAPVPAPEAAARLHDLLAAEPPLPAAFAHRRGDVWFALGVDSFSAVARSLEAVTRFFFKPLNLIDLLAILPLSKGAPVLVVRVVRLARIARLAHLSTELVIVRLVGNALFHSIDSLITMSMMMVIVTVFFGSIAFFIEMGEWDPAQRDWMRTNIAGLAPEPSPFRSIPVSMYWAVVTLTTVGYGDIVPTSGLGRFFGACTVLAGIITLSLPLAVIGANFGLEYARYAACIESGGNGFELSTAEYKVQEKRSSAAHKARVEEMRSDVLAMKQRLEWTERALVLLLQDRGLAVPAAPGAGDAGDPSGAGGIPSE
jgi:voltage-gated potassium channel Kch